MKRFVVAILVLLALRPITGEATWDCLEPPIDLPEEAAYEKLLAEKLYLTRFDCGRVMIEPPYGYGESSLSIYSQDKQHLVTWVEAADSLRDWSDVGRDVGRAENVKIRRVDAEIPRTAATLVKRVWVSMLSDVRAMPKSAAPEYVWGDATIARFSIQLDSRKKLYGETLMVPDNGKKVTQLIQLVNSLQQYCKAEMTVRRSMSKKIEQQAKQLLEELKKK